MLGGYYSRFKVITYNIHSGKNLWQYPQFENIIRFLQINNPDILAIQEIHESTKKGLQVSLMSKKLGMNVHFGPHVIYSDGKYGIANFTKYPITDMKHVLMPSQMERRGFLDTIIKINTKSVHVINTHLSLDSLVRITQLKQIQQYLKSLHTSFVFMGDLNTTNPFINETDTAKVMKKEHLPTIMLSNKRIDYVYVSRDLRIHSYQVASVKLSDHYPVIVELSFNS